MVECLLDKAAIHYGASIQPSMESRLLRYRLKFPGDRGWMGGWNDSSEREEKFITNCFQCELQSDEFSRREVLN